MMVMIVRNCHIDSFVVYACNTGDTETKSGELNFNASDKSLKAYSDFN